MGGALVSESFLATCGDSGWASPHHASRSERMPVGCRGLLEQTRRIENREEDRREEKTCCEGCCSQAVAGRASLIRGDKDALCIMREMGNRTRAAGIARSDADHCAASLAHAAGVVRVDWWPGGWGDGYHEALTRGALRSTTGFDARVAEARRSQYSSTICSHKALIRRGSRLFQEGKVSCYVPLLDIIMRLL